jgi:hypothetical protein
MVEKISFSFIIFFIVIMFDWHSLKKLQLRAVICYTLIMICSLYLSVIYVTGFRLPNLTDLTSFLYGDAAYSIVRLISAS